jgi:hypothetical protein
VQLTNLGAYPLLLQFSRTDETEADALGARLMNEAGYNPIEMARFFEKLQSADIAHPPELLSDHPDPGNRVRAVEAEIQALPQASYSAAAGDFVREKALATQIPTALAPFPAAANRPSGGFRQFQGREFALAYPDNWRAYGDRNAATVTIAPREGIVPGSGAASQVGYGVIVSYYFSKSKTPGLERNTDDLIQHLRASNPSMRLASANRRSLSVESSAALVTTLTSDSPYQGQTETDLLLTVDRPQGLFYMICIAPRSEAAGLRETFDEMIHSIRFSN